MTFSVLLMMPGGTFYRREGFSSVGLAVRVVIIVRVESGMPDKSGALLLSVFGLGFDWRLLAVREGDVLIRSAASNTAMLTYEFRPIVGLALFPKQ